MKHMLLWSMLLAGAARVDGQVETVAIRTTGISCGVCAVVSEINFRRMPGITEVRISLSEETVLLLYKADASLDVARIKDVLQPLGVGVTQLEITARGRLQEQEGKRYFVAGKNRFRVSGAARVPGDATVSIKGVITEPLERMELRQIAHSSSKP